MNRTGAHELRLPDIQSKLGSIFLSTKCCASGTCGVCADTVLVAPVIPRGRDQRNAVLIADTFGNLV